MSYKNDAAWCAASMPLTHTAFGFITTVAAAIAFAPGPALAQQAPLSLDEAMARALDSHPSIGAARAGVEAAEGGRQQAGVIPNPTVSVEVENFGGSDGLRGFQAAETTLAVEQPVERGGRRSARIGLAEREIDLARSDLLIQRLDVLRDVQFAYAEALAADAEIEIARERLTTAEALARSVDRRVAAARDPLMAGARAAAGVADARIGLESAEREGLNARAALASLWGGAADFSMPAGVFAGAASEMHAHDGDPESNPDIVRAAANRERANAALRLERSRGFQDPTISLGVRRFEETGESGVIAGVSIPLGIFDRNRGAIAQAEAERRRSEYELTGARLELSRRFDALMRTRDGAVATVRSLERAVIPQAQRALDLAQNGYDRGAFSYLDVIEAQRALTDAREQRVQALLSYHRNEAELDRLTARFAGAEQE